jgi:ABC-2 type transport system ATP-binding protein
LPSAAAAEFSGVSKRYPLSAFGRTYVQAVHDVTLRIESGQVFALLGPNRAGKTTLVKMLLSLSRPSGGNIHRLGQPIAERGTLARVGYMHENQSFPRYLKAPDLLEYYGALTQLPTNDVRRRVPVLLERVGLADRRHDPISGFSKGMVQRLALAQALINDPELLVLDEPTEGLDLTGRALLAEIIREHKARGRTVLIVSHVLPEVERMCDRVAVIVGGLIVFTGPVCQLRQGDVTFEQALQRLYQKTAT